MDQKTTRASHRRLATSLVASAAVLVATAVGCGSDDDSAGNSAGSGDRAGQSSSGAAGTPSGGKPSGGSSPTAGSAGRTQTAGAGGRATGGSSGAAHGGQLGVGGAGDAGAGDGGVGADAGSGGDGGAPSYGPIGLRPVGGTLSDPPIARVATLGGTVYFDTCPRDQVLIGFSYKNYTDFVNGLTPVCGQLQLFPEQGNLVKITPGITLLERGGASSADGGEARCPANQVVVGYSGIVNDWLRKLTISCATVDVLTQDGAEVVTVGAPTAIPEFGKDAAQTPVVFPYAGCPAGQVARGTEMHAGDWVEALWLQCAPVKLTYGMGAPCSTATDCTGNATCATTCKPMSCTAPVGCDCEQFDGKQYLFCSATADSTYATAGTYCADQNQRLVWSKSGLVNGWLRYGARATGVTDGFWLGLDKLTTADYTWVNGGGALGSGFTDWHEYVNVGSAPCVELQDNGAWSTSACTDKKSFVCE